MVCYSYHWDCKTWSNLALCSPQAKMPLVWTESNICESCKTNENPIMVSYS